MRPVARAFASRYAGVVSRLLIPVALAMLACGPIKAEDTDAASSSTDGMTATGADSEPTGGPVEPAVCDAPADPTDPLGALDVCEDYAAHAPGLDVEIGFINVSGEAIILLGGSQCSGVYFSLQGQPGGHAAHWPYRCGQDPPICDALLAGDDTACDLLCGMPPPIRIEPGGRFTVTWTPSLLAISTELPGGCTPEPGPPLSCTAARRPTASAYTLEAAYVPATSCEGPCTCEPGLDGWCTLEGVGLKAMAPEFAAQGKYDGICTVADVVIR